MTYKILNNHNYFIQECHYITNERSVDTNKSNKKSHNSLEPNTTGLVKAAILNDAVSTTNTNDIRCLSSIAIIKSKFLNSMHLILTIS